VEKLLIAWLTAGAVLQPAPALSRVSDLDPCVLLDAAEIRAVQGTTVKETKRSSESSKGRHFAQCFFVTDDFARSVSLTLISGDGRRYWAETFQRPQTSSRKKDPPRTVAGFGDEAFWTGDGRAGALYLLSGDRVLRISVGGVDNEEERIRRSRTLALAALGRLKQL
jgi:hypothetical protein